MNTGAALGALCQVMTDDEVNSLLNKSLISKWIKKMYFSIQFHICLSFCGKLQFFFGTYSEKDL